MKAGLVRSGLGMVAGMFIAGVSGWAQQALYVEYRGQAQLVRKVHDGHPYVMDGGKLVRVTNDRTGLIDVEEFLPLFVSVRKMRATTSFINLSLAVSNAGEVNHTFEFHADFESPYPLENVFLVLELQLASGKRIFCHEVGDLQPRQPEHVSVYVPVGERLDERNFKLHLFSDGGELLHSGQPDAYREQMLDRMVARRIAGVTDAPPQPFVGPGPEYPESQSRQQASGEAVVKLRLSRTGTVVDPVVRSATAPEFGEAALAAVRQWRFLPAMRDGAPVEARLEMPFRFVPPEQPRK